MGGENGNREGNTVSQNDGASLLLGRRLEAFWDKDKNWFSGTIYAHTDSDVVDIIYDIGVREKLNLKLDVYRWIEHAPRNRSTKNICPRSDDLAPDGGFRNADEIRAKTPIECLVEGNEPTLPRQPTLRPKKVINDSHDKTEATVDDEFDKNSTCGSPTSVHTQGLTENKDDEKASIDKDTDNRVEVESDESENMVNDDEERLQHMPTSENGNVMNVINEKSHPATENKTADSNSANNSAIPPVRAGESLNIHAEVNAEDGLPRCDSTKDSPRNPHGISLMGPTALPSSHPYQGSSDRNQRGEEPGDAQELGERQEEGKNPDSFRSRSQQSTSTEHSTSIFIFYGAKWWPGKLEAPTPQGQRIVFNENGASLVVPWDQVNECIRMHDKTSGVMSVWPYSSPPGRVPLMEQTWAAEEGMRLQGLKVHASQGMRPQQGQRPRQMQPSQMQPPTSYNVTSSMDTTSVPTSSSTTVESRRRGGTRKRSASNSPGSDSITSALKLRWSSGATGPIPRAAALELKPPSPPAKPRVKGRPGLGTLWVNWGTESKRVPRDAVQPYLDAGWALGRHWQPRNHNRSSTASTRKRRASAAPKNKTNKKTKHGASPAEVAVPSQHGEFLEDGRGSFEDSQRVFPSQQFRRVEGFAPAPGGMPSSGSKLPPSLNRNVVDDSVLNPWEAMEAVGGWLQEPQGRGRPSRNNKNAASILHGWKSSPPGVYRQLVQQGKIDRATASVLTPEMISAIDVQRAQEDGWSDAMLMLQRENMLKQATHLDNFALHERQSDIGYAPQFAGEELPQYLALGQRDPYGYSLPREYYGHHVF